MTETEWLACTDPDPMLEFLRGKTSQRKLRFLACACVRRILHLLEDNQERFKANERCKAAIELATSEAELAKKAVEVAERFADGKATEAELKAVYPDDEEASCYAAGPDAAWTAKASAYRARYIANYYSPSSYPPGAAFRSPSPSDHDREQAAQCHLLRDIFGNPFRPITFDPSWLTPTVIHLAQAIYDDRSFDQMPTLADALEKSGCDNAEILAHCRGAGPHVKGCWVVDAMLGKEAMK